LVVKNINAIALLALTEAEAKSHKRLSLVYPNFSDGARQSVFRLIFQENSEYFGIQTEKPAVYRPALLDDILSKRTHQGGTP
jgi:hypothetical protein